MDIYYRISRGLGKVPFGAWEVFCDSAEQGGLPRAGVVANPQGHLNVTKRYANFQHRTHHLTLSCDCFSTEERNESLWKQIRQKFI